MKVRNRFLMFLLMNMLEGIYLLYWQGSVQNDIKDISRKGISGGLTVFLSILTLGIYAFVWQWKTCNFLSKQGCKNLKIITFILSLLIIGLIVNPILIQGQINVLANSKMRLF